MEVYREIIKSGKLLLLMLTMALPTMAQQRQVLLETTEGNILLALYDDTPRHRDNFLRLV